MAAQGDTNAIADATVSDQDENADELLNLSLLCVDNLRVRWPMLADGSQSGQRSAHCRSSRRM